MLTIIAIIGMLFTAWLFYSGHVEAGIIMFLVSWWVWASD